MEFECPKCNRWGMEWDGRAKIIICPYYSCKHTIKLEGFEHHGIPTGKEIMSAIEDDKDMANDKITIKYMRRVYYTCKARPETHLLHVNKKDSVSWLVEFHIACGRLEPLAVFIDAIKNGVGEPCFFKGILTKFFVDGPTAFVFKETDLAYGKG